MTLRAIPPLGRKAIGKQDHLQDTRWGGIALLTLMKKTIIIIALIALAGCAKKNPHPDHIPGISCPQKGHGKCPFGCDED